MDHEGGDVDGVAGVQPSHPDRGEHQGDGDGDGDGGDDDADVKEMSAVLMMVVVMSAGGVPSCAQQSVGGWLPRGEGLPSTRYFSSE